MSLLGERRLYEVAAVGSKRVAVRWRRSLVILLFTAVILFFPLEACFIITFGQPYPALVMPGFGGTMADGAKIKIRNVRVLVHFRDGAMAQLTQARLLAEAPDSHHTAIMELQFHSTTDHLQQTPHSRPPRWFRRLRQFVTHAFPGYARRTERRDALAVHPQTRECLRQRLLVLYPDQQATRVCFQWYDEIFTFVNGATVITQEPYGDFEVRLTDDP